MCTFLDEVAVTVCDVAIGRVRAGLEAAFPGAITFTHVEGEGTLVQAEAATPPAFGAVVRAPITAAAGVPSATPNTSGATPRPTEAITRGPVIMPTPNLTLPPTDTLPTGSGRDTPITLGGILVALGGLLVPALALIVRQRPARR